MMRVMIGVGVALLITVLVSPVAAEHRALERLETPAARAAGDTDAATVAGDMAGPSRTTEKADRAGGSSDLDLQLKLGGKGFRLGGRVMGQDGVAGAWLNGHVGDRGVYFDGRVQRRDGRAWNFRLDAEVDDWWPRVAWRMMLGHPLPFLDIR